MSRKLLDQLLLGDERDPGCEVCFEVFDEYVEAILRGDPVEELFPHVVAHLAGCQACREDTEGLIAALRGGVPPEDPK